MTDPTLFFAISVFAAGLVSFFSPCILPLLPVYAATLSSGLDGVDTRKAAVSADLAAADVVHKQRFRIHWRLVAQTAVFVGGLATTFILLGFGAGAIGGLLSSRTFLTIAGALVILLGLHQTGILHLVFLEREKRLFAPGIGRTGVLGSYLLGLTFSFGWTPCIGPVLATVLVISSSGHQALYGAGMMLIFTLGLAVPFMLISIFTDVLLRTFRKINRYLPIIRVVGGVLIILMGILLMTDNLNVISRLLIRP